MASTQRPPSSPGLIFPSQSPIGSGTLRPLGAAVDGGGNAYVADTDHGRILLEALSSGSYAQTAIVTGLDSPYGVAVDGGGNLYIAETYYPDTQTAGYGRVLKETRLSTGAYTQSVIADGTTTPYAMDYPNDVAVDGSGNVYIANSSASQLIKETLQSSGSYTQRLVADASTLPNALNSPRGFAVDGSGNVFVSNTGSYQVLKETLSGPGAYTQSLVATLASGSFDSPFGVAVDGSGNVYVTDAASNQLLRETPSSSGSYTQSMAWAVNQPYGVAVDGSGNPIVTAPYFGNGAVYKLNVSSPPSLAFAATAAGVASSDSSETVTVTNSGNAPLSFATPAAAGTLNPSIDPDFSYGASSTCTQTGSAESSFTLGAGDSCTELISFLPQTAGAISGSVVNTDDNLNVAGATQSIALNGTATAGTPTVSVASLSAPYGTGNATLTAAVSYGGAAPVGAVTFTLNTNPNAPQVAVCSASSGTRTCTATDNVSSLQAGTYSVSVSEAADQNYSAASGTGSLTITQAAPSVMIAPQSMVYGTAQSILAIDIA